MRKVAHRGVQITARVLGIAQGIPPVELLLKVTPPELKGRLDLYVFGRAATAGAAKFRMGCID